MTQPAQNQILRGNDWESWDGSTRNFVWDSDLLAWVAMAQPSGSGGGTAEVVKLKNVAGSTINPATEDTLSSVLSILTTSDATLTTIQTAIADTSTILDQVNTAGDASAELRVIAMNSLVPNMFDAIGLGYTGDDLTTVTYTLSGVTVATLGLTYTNGKLTAVVRA